VRVLVVGLRATGAVVAGWLRERGDEVTVVEEHPGQAGYAERRAAAEASGITVIEGAVDWTALTAAADLMVPSPGVRPNHPAMLAARAASLAVRGDLDLAVEASSVPVVVVTGTNGKSTVTTLISAMLERSGRRAPAVGNIGRVALDALVEPADVLVIEASSFQLHTVTPLFAPAVAVVLNLADDHLDWHGAFAEYAAAKAQVFEFQTADDLLVFNLDDPLVVDLVRDARSRRVGFALDGPRPGAVTWQGTTLVDAHGSVVLTRGERDFAAPHERANVAAAAAVALALGATGAGITLALNEFTRLHHRTEPVGKAGDVEYVDDSKATNPHAAVAAVRGFRNVVLLAGGDSKGVDLGALTAVTDHLRGVVAIGNTPEEVERVFADRVPTRRAPTMRAAVRAAADLAHAGDVVLLAPACASFDWYDSYSERGDDFRAEVEALIAETEAEGDRT
jgi:UDP-N-acetylmuramoylalanine--D-glutamate ligase